MYNITDAITSLYESDNFTVRYGFETAKDVGESERATKDYIALRLWTRTTEKSTYSRIVLQGERFQKKKRKRKPKNNAQPNKQS